MFDSGVSVCVTTKPFEVALTCFLGVGVLPEWPLLLCCNGKTSWEEVSNLVHRWRTLDAPHNLFCICGIDELGTAVSQELASLLLQHEPSSLHQSFGPSSLVLISSSPEHHLVRQLTAH